MNVQEAAVKAKQHVEKVFGDEQPTNVGLEEIEFDRTAGEWSVTVAFSRPWNSIRSALSAISGEPIPRRVYKTVRLSDASGDLISIKRQGTED